MFAITDLEQYTKDKKDQDHDSVLTTKQKPGRKYDRSCDAAESSYDLGTTLKQG